MFGHFRLLIELFNTTLFIQRQTIVWIPFSRIKRATTPVNVAQERERRTTQRRHVNAKERKGILGIVGLCVGMLYRVTDGQIGNLRQSGVHTAATAVLRGIDLHPKEEEKARSSKALDITLKYLLRHLIMESDMSLEVQCQGVPQHQFPMKKGTMYWDLSSDPGEQT